MAVVTANLVVSLTHLGSGTLVRGCLPQSVLSACLWSVSLIANGCRWAQSFVGGIIPRQVGLGCVTEQVRGQQARN